MLKSEELEIERVKDLAREELAILEAGCDEYAPHRLARLVPRLLGVIEKLEKELAALRP